MPSALDYLGITPPGNPLSQFFPQPEDDFRNRLEERPANRTRLPPEYAIASQLPDPMGFLKQFQSLRSQNETGRALGELQNLDFGAKDYTPSVAKLISKYPNAAQNPAFQNVLRLKEFSGKQTQDSKYDSEAANLAKGVLSISEDDPEYPTKFQKVIEGASPEALTHPRLVSQLERGMHNSAMVRSKKNAQVDDAHRMSLQLAEAGIPPEQFGKFKTEDGGFDPYKVAFALGQAKRGLKSDAAPMSSKQREELADSFQSLDEPASDEDAVSAYNTAHSANLDPKSWFNKPSAQQVEEGKRLAQQEKSKKLLSRLTSLHKAGVSISDAIQSYLGSSPPTSQPTPPVIPSGPQAAPLPAQSAMTSIPTFSSPEEAETSNLPSGTIVIIGGRKFRKD